MKVTEQFSVSGMDEVYTGSPDLRGVPMSDPFAIEYDREYAYQTTGLRRYQLATRVCVAGLGGGGGLLAEALTRDGYEVRGADPDNMERSNSRLLNAAGENIGRNKAQVTALYANAIQPAHEMQVWEEGVTEDNVEDFLLSGSKKSQQIIAVDEIDINRPDIAWMFNKVARKHDIPVITGVDIGRGGFVTVYDPRSKHTFERINKIPKHIETPQQLVDENVKLPLVLPYVPKNGSIDTLLSVKEGAPTPSTLDAVLVTTALCRDEVRRLVAERNGVRGYQRPTYAPRFRWQDPENGVSGSTRFPAFSFYKHLGHAYIRDKVLHGNPEASYTLAEIEQRREYRIVQGETE